MLPADIRYQYLYNEYEEKKIINNFIRQLEVSVEEKFGIKSSGKLVGSKKQGHYTIYFRPAVDNKCSKSIELTMDLCSPEIYRLIKDEEMDMDISDKDLDILCYNRAKLVKAIIHGLYTFPKNIGLGGFLVKEVIGFLKGMEAIQFIALMPRDTIAQSFWSHMGFIKIDKKILGKYNDITDIGFNNKMIYEFY